jgi:hypothetical protein
VSAATAAVIMGSAELAMLPSSPSFAATLEGAINPHILVVDVRKPTLTKDEGSFLHSFLSLFSQQLIRHIG